MRAFVFGFVTLLSLSSFASTHTAQNCSNFEGNFEADDLKLSIEKDNFFNSSVITLVNGTEEIIVNRDNHSYSFRYDWVMHTKKEKLQVPAIVKAEAAIVNASAYIENLSLEGSGMIVQDYSYAPTYSCDDYGMFCNKVIKNLNKKLNSIALTDENKDIVSCAKTLSQDIRR